MYALVRNRIERALFEYFDCGKRTAFEKLQESPTGGGNVIDFVGNLVLGNCCDRVTAPRN